MDDKTRPRVQAVSEKKETPLKSNPSLPLLRPQKVESPVGMRQDDDGEHFRLLDLGVANQGRFLPVKMRKPKKITDITNNETCETI